MVLFITLLKANVQKNFLPEIEWLTVWISVFFHKGTAFHLFSVLSFIIDCDRSKICTLYSTTLQVDLLPHKPFRVLQRSFEGFNIRIFLRGLLWYQYLIKLKPNYSLKWMMCIFSPLDRPICIPWKPTDMAACHLILFKSEMSQWNFLFRYQLYLSFLTGAQGPKVSPDLITWGRQCMKPFNWQ